MSRSVFSFIITLLWSFGISQAWADIGPKPTVDITLPGELANHVVAGTLLLCQKSDCSDALPMQDVGPQGFSCRLSTSDKIGGSHGYVASHLPVGHCGGLGYGFSPFLQLKLNLKEGNDIVSSVFTKKEFDAHFLADFYQGKLTVIEQ